jgi:hypothetical protein
LQVKSSSFLFGRFGFAPSPSCDRFLNTDPGQERILVSVENVLELVFHGHGPSPPLLAEVKL